MLRKNICCSQKYTTLPSTWYWWPYWQPFMILMTLLTAMYDTGYLTDSHLWYWWPYWQPFMILITLLTAIFIVVAYHYLKWRSPKINRNKAEFYQFTALPCMDLNAQKMKFSIKDFISICDQIHRKLRIWSHLLKKSLMKNFIFCTVHNTGKHG